jgi:hypothetical protein
LSQAQYTSVNLNKPQYIKEQSSLRPAILKENHTNARGATVPIVVGDEQTGTASPAVGNNGSDRDSSGRFLPGNGASAPYRWVPGQSGNPAGRPPKPKLDFKLKDLLLERMNEPWTGPAEAKRLLGLPENCTIGQAYVAMLVSNAMKPKPSPTAMREVNERTAGKVPLPIRLGQGEDDEALGELRITLVDPRPVPVLPPSSGNGNGNGQPDIPE